MGSIKQLENLSQLEHPEIEFKEDKLIQQLSEATEILLDKIIWYKNIHIKNKIEERQRFKEARKQDESFKPNFKFQEFRYNEKKILKIIEQCRKASQNIEKNHLDKYNSKKLDSESLQKFFEEIFQELKLYTELAANIEQESKWRALSEKIWPMIDEEAFKESKKQLKEIEKEDLERNISPEQLAEMFTDELKKLDMDYKVEIRKTSGCKNIPEDKTLVIAKGEDGKRTFSKKEAEMLTKHETFHAVRAHNGFNAGKKSGFPKILGLHTPFYDRAEEGGALYREEKTRAAYKNKELDYHLRLIAAYRIANSKNYKEDFKQIVEDLIDLGENVDRAFYLAARNREALRHHIYQAGRNDWKNIKNKEKMLTGKLNPKWSEKFWEEAEAGGMIQKPEIKAEKLFKKR